MMLTAMGTTVTTSYRQRGQRHLAGGAGDDVLIRRRRIGRPHADRATTSAQRGHGAPQSGDRPPCSANSWRRASSLPAMATLDADRDPASSQQPLADAAARVNAI